MSMQTSRAVVHSNNGGVAASQPLAVSAALNILQRGGSCIDAGIAASAVLIVVEPSCSHLGGDAFLVVHDAKTRKNIAFNGSGESPHNATALEFEAGIPKLGFRAGTVPGLVSTWFAAHKTFGRLPISELLQPAIEYAKNGFPANADFVKRIETFMKMNPGSTLFETLEISTELSVGDIVIQKDLANSLTLIAQQGRDAFYKGEIAEKIIEATNGWFNADDLAAHKTRVTDPISAKYRDLTIHGQPPPSQGMVLIEELLLASGYDLEKISEADRIHLLVEIKKLAFEDRNRILADPEKRKVALDEIFAKEHIDKRRSEINMKVANNGNSKVGEEGNDTTYFLVADG
ncbi:MAG: hypothetical protein F2657_03055, partial [Actinobacteria bacterium]|nr:hypothetical protein [Actinomycetota bacterium]